MDEKPNAFVIMPFDVEFTSIYEKLIKEPLEDAGYQVARADSLLDQRNILGDIIRGIRGAELVVADLTTNNPNVFYELGLCHGLGLPTVLIAQSIDDVPFDLRSYKILIYETHFNKIEKLKRGLKEIGMKHRAEGLTFDNPVKDFSESNTEPIESPTKIVLDKASIDPIEDDDGDDDGKELLDFLADGERAAQDLTSVLAKVLKDNEVVTNRITKHAASMQALSNNPVAGSAGKFHKIALLAGSDMNNFSRKVEDILPSFEKAIDRLDRSYSGFITIADPQTQNKEGLSRFRKSIESLLGGAQTAGASMDSYRGAVIGLGARRLSKDLSRASGRLAEALNGIISNVQRVEGFCERTLAMMDSKFVSELEP
jgi:hypothetical protein